MRRAERVAAAPVAGSDGARLGPRRRECQAATAARLAVEPVRPDMRGMGIVLILIVAALVALPQLWVRGAMKRHAADRPDLPGTGGELAAHLAEHHALQIGVERTDRGSHYDPDARMVRLTPDIYDGRSLTAVAVATHEIGHAIQHERGERGLAWRQSLARVAMVTDRFAGLFFLAAPVLAVLLRSPVALAAMVGIGVCFLGLRVLVHLVTLPVEFDASFGKALPILKQGGYLDEADLPAARSVLKAAACTYVAGALMGLLDLARWLRLLR